MRIISKDSVEIKTLDDYKSYAPPKEEYQWKKDHSAMEFAKKMVNGSFDHEVCSIIQDLNIIEGYPEKHSYFDEFGGPRNHDLACIAEINNEKIVICVEAKATENFGSNTVGKELDAARKKIEAGINTNIPKRISGICKLLWGNIELSTVSDIQYQLLHATAGTIAFAKETKVEKAIFLIYQLETDKTNDIMLNEHFEAAQSFVRLFGKELVKNILCPIKTIDNIELTFLYMQKKKDQEKI